MKNETCPCEYPVDVERARKAFARAVVEIDAVLARFTEEFKAHDDWERAVGERRQENARIRNDNARRNGHWYTDPDTYHGMYGFGLVLDGWRHSRDYFDGLLILAERATALTLSRKEIASMAEAETRDYMGRAIVAAERIRTRERKAMPLREVAITAREEKAPEPRSAWRFW